MSSCCSGLVGPPRDLSVSSLCTPKAAICNLKSDSAVINNLNVININNAPVAVPPARMAALFQSNPATSFVPGAPLGPYSTTFLRDFTAVGGSSFQVGTTGLYLVTVSLVFTSFSFNALQVQFILNGAPFPGPNGFVIDQDTSNGASTMSGSQLLSLSAGDTISLLYFGLPNPLDVFQISFVVDEMA